MARAYLYLVFLCSNLAVLEATLSFNESYSFGREDEDVNGKNGGSENGTCLSSLVSEADVFEYLKQTNPTYLPDARPRRNGNEVVEVILGFELVGIKNFFEHSGTLVLQGYFFATWLDEFYKWDGIFPYSCVNFVTLENTHIWRPDLVVLTDSKAEFREYVSSGKLNLFSNGIVELSPVGAIAVNCELNLSMFPFDSQACSIFVDSWTYDNQRQALILTPGEPFPIFETLWVEHRQWDIIDNRSQILKPDFGNAEAVYDRAAFCLLLRRKPLFYFVHIIAPGIAIGIIELVVFVLPSSDVTKLWISVTCLLAYSVFQKMIITDMPRSGTSIPLLTIYIDLQMAYIGVIAILGEGIAFLIYRNFLPNYSTNITAKVNTIPQQRHASIVQRHIELQWQYVAEVIDGVILILYLLFLTLTPIIMFGVIPQHATRFDGCISNN